MADKGYEKNEFIAKKLDTHVLFLETSDMEKYELAKSKISIIQDMENGIEETYQFSKIKEPLKCDNLYFSNNPAPLEPSMIDILFPALEW